ncbi:MAG: sulfatase-like hydrolase/transferase [Bryobacteraceae bacterium]|nr:sulfatase-like hydrolase/transferase [Bryobacteraceae bacterium]MDW8379563.1 sulfatase-like hydrolase/transferase [Bryobacterales bacterium]
MPLPLKPSRRKLLANLLAVPAVHATKRTPNFILITCDDLGYADIQPYRREVSYTPHLERMARQGTRFTSFYAAPVCTPSRAALMTGCYPKRVGLAQGSWHAVLMPGDWFGLHPQETTVARLLKSKNYATACVGKWHLGDQPEFMPTRHGFDSYFGIPYSNDMRPSPKPAGKQTRPHPPLPLVRNEKLVKEVTDQSFLTAAYTEEAVQFIRAHRNRPYFLYLPHSMVHVPLAVSNRFLHKTGNGLFADAVAEVDWSVGEILAAVERKGEAENTLVIFLSDNGGTVRSVNTPLRGHKGSVWEGGMRVPAIFWRPGTVAANHSSDEIASNMDILPTFAALAGAALPRVKIDGQNLEPLLRGNGRAKSAYSAFYFYQGHFLRAVRSGKWKLHTSGELYNLEQDIGESHDVARANPDVVAHLQHLLDQARADLGDGPEPGPGCRPVGKAKGPLKFWIPRPTSSGYEPHAPVQEVPGAPYDRTESKNSAV